MDAATDSKHAAPQADANSKLQNTAENPTQDCGCDAPSPAPVTDKIPTTSDVEKIGELQVRDAEGKSLKFREVYGDSGAERHLVIFIRHFFCGNCREYLRTLCSSIPPSNLPENTKISIVGCGSHELVSNYAKSTNCTYPLYVDPSQELYKALDLARTLQLGNKKPEYIKQSMFSSVMTSVFDGIKSGKKATKGGDWWQDGGEFLFVKDGDGWKVEWCHRMKTTRDHTEMAELKKVLGVSAS